MGRNVQATKTVRRDVSPSTRVAGPWRMLSPLLAVAVLYFATSQAQAQPAQAQEEPGAPVPLRPPRLPNRLFPGIVENVPEDGHGPAQFVVDRQTSRSLETARELIDSNDFTQAVPLLQRVLDGAEDFGFEVDRSKETFRSAKQEALNLLRSLPAAGQEAYEREFGPAARQMLERSQEQGNVKILQEVARRYLHTEAGNEAAYRLSSYYLDRSEPTTAALYARTIRGTRNARKYEPMLSLKEAIAWYRAGDEKQAAQLLTSIREVNRGRKITIGGRDVPVFENGDEASSWLKTHLGPVPPATGEVLRDWLMARGEPSRNAGSTAIPFGSARWSADIFDGPPQSDSQQREQISNQWKGYERGLRDANVLTIPVAQPVVVDNLVIYRGPRNLGAFRIDTGELVWESAFADPHFVQIVERARSIPTSLSLSEQSPQRLLHRERTWRDSTWGALSSDGNNVFAVEDLGFWGLGNELGMRNGEPQNPLTQRHSNRLIAYSAATGKMQWQVGGPRGEQSLELAGTFFLGAPLPLGSELYCLGEVDGEIRLVVLDAKTGGVSWMQRLLFPDAKLQHYPIRRIAGTAPSYADGILVCPTTAGAVFGIDLHARKLAWVFQYPAEITDESTSLAIKELDEQFLGQMDEESRWLDSTAVVSNGRVLVTPRDSQFLFCVDLNDGSLKWKRPRGDSLFVAGVHRGNVVLVGRSRIEGVSLADQKSAWGGPVAISRPNGRGVLQGDLYAVPLVDGEIATVDLKAGRLRARTRVEGADVGNLVSVRDTIVSQSANRITAYHSLEFENRTVTARIEKVPDDPDALALRGEIRLHLGQSEPGLADLRRSIELKPDSRARGLLARQLLDGLKSDFASYRKLAGEAEKLIDSAGQRFEFHLALAEGYEKTGEHQAAWREYVNLSQRVEVMREMIAVDANTTARADGAVATKIAQLYESSSERLRAQFDSEAAAHLEKLKQAGDPAVLRRFAVMFRTSPVSRVARRILFESLDSNKDSLAIEFELEQLRRSTDASAASWATAKLAELLINRGHASDAVTLFEEVEELWKDERLLDEKTGSELVAAWKENASVAKALAQLEDWPVRHLQIQFMERSESRRPMVSSLSGMVPRTPIKLKDSQGRFLEHWTIEEDRQERGENPVLVARDADGVVRWKHALTFDNSANDFPERIRFFTVSGVRGHFLLVLSRGHLVALDLLADPASPKQLWARNIEETVAQEPGRPRVVSAVNGPINEQFFCYQVGTTLYAANTLTGETIWERRNVSQYMTYFGDDEFVICRLAQRQNSEAIVLRASDGGIVSSQPLPVVGMVLPMTAGRNLLSWTNLRQQSIVSLTDAASGRVVWQREFGASAAFAGVGDDELAVLDPRGNRFDGNENDTAQFTILSIADGRPRLDVEIEGAGRPASISVIRRPQSYALFTYTPERNAGSSRAAMPMMGTGNARANRRAFGFDAATGKRLWATEIPDCMVNTEQPPGLPVAILKVVTRSTGRPRIVSVDATVLDLRNGEFIHRQTIKGLADPIVAEIDRENWKAVAEMPNASIQLSLSDIPLTEPPPKRQLSSREPVRAVKPGEPAPLAPGADPDSQ